MGNDDKSQVQFAQALKRYADNMTAMTEHEKLKARVIRAKYLALIEQGFTEAQAIELCKNV